MSKFKVAREPYLTFWKKLASYLGETEKTIGRGANAAVLTEFMVGGVNMAQSDEFMQELTKFAHMKGKEDFMSASTTVFMSLIFGINETGMIPEDAKPVMKEWHKQWMTSYEKNKHFKEIPLRELEAIAKDPTSFAGDTVTWQCTPFFWFMTDAVLRNAPKDEFIFIVKNLEAAASAHDEILFEHSNAAQGIADRIQDLVLGSYYMDVLYPTVESDYQAEAKKLLGVEKLDDFVIDDSIVQYLEAEWQGDKILLDQHKVRHFIALIAYAYTLINKLKQTEEYAHDLHIEAESSAKILKSFFDQYFNEKKEMEERIRKLGKKLSRKAWELRNKESVVIKPETKQRDSLNELNDLYEENQRLQDELKVMEEERIELIKTITELQNKLPEEDYPIFETPRIVNYFGLDPYIVGEMRKYNVIINIYSPVKAPDSLAKSHTNVLNVSYASHKVWNKLKSMGIKPIVVTESNVDILKGIIMNELLKTAGSNVS